MFANWEKFQSPPRHPKWKEINLAATVPGWTRWAPAEELLQAMRRRSQQQARSVGSGVAVRSSSIDFDKLTDAERERLYQEFQQWQQREDTSRAADVARPALGLAQRLHRERDDAIGRDIAHASGDGPSGMSACGRAGRTIRSSISTTAASGLSGAQCHGLVGPKMPIAGVPIAAATCRSPELFDTATLGGGQRQNGVAQVRSGHVAGIAPDRRRRSRRRAPSRPGPPRTQTCTPSAVRRRASSA